MFVDDFVLSPMVMAIMALMLGVAWILFDQIIAKPRSFSLWPIALPYITTAVVYLYLAVKQDTPAYLIIAIARSSLFFTMLTKFAYLCIVIFMYRRSPNAD